MKATDTNIKFQIKGFSDALAKDGTFNLYVSEEEIISSLFSAKKQLLSIETVKNSAKSQVPNFFYDYLSEYSSFLKNEDLQNIVKQKILSAATNRWSIVPGELFAEGQVKEFLSLTADIEVSKDTFYELKSDYLDIYFLFALPTLLVKRADFFFPDIQYYHPLYLLLQNFKPLYNSVVQQVPFFIQIHFNLNKMFVLLFQGETLLLANMYNIRAAEDAIYYIYEIHHKLEVAHKDTTCLISGISIIKDKLASMVKKIYNSVLPAQKLFAELHHPDLAELGLFPMDFAHFIDYTAS